MRRLFATLALLTLVACSSSTDTTAITPPTTVAAPLRTLFDQVSVGAGGGALQYNKAGDALNGLTLTIPAGAYPTASVWSIVADSNVAVTLPSGFTQVGPALAIINNQGYATTPLTLKMPMVVGAGNTVVPFYYNPATRKLEGIPTVDLKPTYLTLATENFSNASTVTNVPSQTALRSAQAPTVVKCESGFAGVCIVWVKLSNTLLQGSFTTTFAPGQDDWEFENTGDYLTPNGMCEGMSTTAMYYHYFVEGSSRLYHRYDASLNDKWDNVQGMRFAGSVQADFRDVYNSGFDIVDQLNAAAGANAGNKDPIKSLTANWLVATLKLTSEPVLVALYGTGVAHAVVAYAASMNGDQTVVSIADPNFPAKVRTMTFEAGTLTPLPFLLTVGDDARSVDRAYAIGVTAQIPLIKLDARWVEFKSKTAGKDRYPQGYTWTTFNFVSGTFDAMPSVVRTSYNKFFSALICASCTAKVPGVTPADRQRVIAYDATGANVVPADANGDVTLTPGSTTFVLAAFPKSPFNTSRNAFLDSRSVTVIYSPGTFGLSVTTAPLNVVPGVPATDTVQINRTNYFSPVTITAVSDAGITITPSESPSPGTQTTLTVNVPNTVAVGTTHSVTVTAVGVDLAPVVTTFAVVAVTTPTFTMSVQNAPLTITAGTTSLPDNVNITRTNFNGPITLSDSAALGITVNYSSQPGTGLTGTFTVSVSPSMPPNTYIVTLTGTSSLAPKKTSFAVVVPAAPLPRIVFNPAAITATIAGSDQVNVSVTNPIAGGTLVLAVRDPTVAAYSPSSNNGISARGSITGLRSGSTFMDATYTAGSVVVRDAAPIMVPGGNSRVNRIIIEPRDQQVTAPVGFTYRVRFLDAAGNTTTPETAAEGGAIYFFNSDSTVATVTQSTTDPTIAPVVSKRAGTTNITVLYTRNNVNSAVDNVDLTVNAAATSGYGSLTISTANSARQLRTSETLLFQVLVRDVNNVLQTTGVTGLTVTITAANGSVITLQRTGDQSGYFYTIPQLAPGQVTLKASVSGAATSLFIVVTP